MKAELRLVQLLCFAVALAKLSVITSKTLRSTKIKPSKL